jgi:hypothetical protein
MKKLCTLLFAVILGTSVFAQDFKPYFQKSFNNVSVQKLVVTTEGGSIIVNGSDSKNADVQVSIKCNGPAMTDAQIEQDIKDNYTFTVNIDNGKLNAQLIRKSGDLPADKRLYASFIVLVPRNVSTDLSTAGARISLNGVNGDQQLATSGGDITVTSTTGSVKCSNAGGSILLRDVTQKIDLSDAGGNIIVSHCSGAIDIANAGGKIVLSNVGGNIKAGNSRADILASNVRGNLTASNVGGNVSLFDLSCKVSAVTTNGNVYAKIRDLEDSRLIVSEGKLMIVIPKQLNGDLALDADKINAEKLDNFKGTNTDGRLIGQVNNGGAKLIGSSTGGEIDIESL